MTQDLTIARLRLSKFVREQALKITRINRINFEESEQAPESYVDVCNEFNQAKLLNKTVRVYKGASENTKYDTPATNWSFRFWHDYLHYSRQLDFTVQSEKLVGGIQCANVASEFGLGSLEYKLMHLDTIEQVNHYERTGQFVENQLGFAKAIFI
jgi:hypothetical protein